MASFRSAVPAFRFLPGVLAVLLLFPGWCAAAGPPPPCLAVIAPRSGDALPPGKALVIGTAKGEGLSRVEIEVNGKGRTDVPVRGGGFSAAVPIAAGSNLIRVSAGKTSVSVAVTGSEKGGYRYHEEAERCVSCHDRTGNGYALPGPKDALCYRCHDRQDTGKVVHGPLGGGDCTACHDPHGSANVALTVARPERLCLFCHDQESSTKHMRESRGRLCTECHDPHSSDRTFLRKK
ncbi:MAG: hypothetical protein Kow00128_23180 [Deltaproteobacteria bacterium]